MVRPAARDRLRRGRAFRAPDQGKNDTALQNDGRRARPFFNHHAIAPLSASLSSCFSRATSNASEGRWVRPLQDAFGLRIEVGMLKRAQWGRVSMA
jgi:hypothetical protein